MMSSIDWDTVTTGQTIRGFCIATEPDFRLQGSPGRGVIRVMGDLRVASNYRFKGIVYVEGRLTKATGTSKFLGTIIVKSQYQEEGGGGGTAQIHLSTQAVDEEVTGALSRFIRLSWREKP